ncbi:MAG: SPOR domain-containing protein, partial [Pseudomonadota bacterium]
SASPPPKRTVTAQAQRAAKPTPKPTTPSASGTAISSWSSSVARQAPPKTATKPKRQQVAALNWSNTTARATPAAIPAKAKPTRAVAAKPKPRGKAKAKPKGRFNVQIATVRDKAIAEQIRAQIAGQAPRELGQLKPRVDTAVLGNMGTFFRVRVDGLASIPASKRLCDALIRKGHDCFLIRAN